MLLVLLPCFINSNCRSFVSLTATVADNIATVAVVDDAVDVAVIDAVVDADVDDDDVAVVDAVDAAFVATLKDCCCCFDTCFC